MTPDIQTGIALTPTQMYAIFCDKMAKFDAEFAHLDKIQAMAWLNDGVKRLVDQLLKRLQTNPDDQMPFIVLQNYIANVELSAALVQDDDPYIYKAGDKMQDLLVLPDIHIYKSLQLHPPVDKDHEDEFPKWWPHGLVGDEVVGQSMLSDFVDVTHLYDTDMNRILNNSFSEVYAGPNSKVFLKRDVCELPYIIITGSPFQGIQARKDVEPDKNKTSFWQIDKVEIKAVDTDELYKSLFIDTAIEDDTYEALPAIVHNDIVDYAIDAYFEAQFMQTQGKQTQKMARQDAEPVQQSANNSQ